ncbi:hypothetical protein [Paraglaciecola chathamensis]|uniref:hypothetical protein n=1 Tax=Paraglaciecola chathamensis TaxID=368405 RepID=UPI0002F75338|nr:hypothetical protein [Paraglaciecola agarilytica]
MNNKIYLIIAISCHTTSYAGSIGHTPLCNQSENVNFIISDIFDLDDPDTALIHRWANFFHIKTHEYTIINESAFFLKKCQIEKEDVDELERYLRQRKYIREAKVTLENSGKFLVETWDNWSLMPTIDFGRKGGVNKYSIGVKDRNLLGLGIDSEIEYFSNNQRSGYKFDASFPLYLNKNNDSKCKIN